MKENDGRAARNKKKRRFLTILSIVGIMIVVVIAVKTTFSNGDGDHGISAAERTSRAAQVLRELHAHGKEAADQAHQALRRRASNGAHNVAQWMQQHAPHGHGHTAATAAAGGHGTGGGGRDDGQQGGDDTAAAGDDDGQAGKDGDRGDFGDDDDPGMQKVLQARYMIMSIRPPSRRGRVAFDMHGGYTGLIASFCHLDWTQPKADATTTPMFHDLVDKSKGCQRPVQYELYDVVQKARAYDEQYPEKIKQLNLTGVVFHESRCGSTLVANALASMNPEKHRVYSESTPPIAILRMSEDDDGGGAILSPTQAATILKDVIYLMSRTNDLQEERVFFKFQSIGTRSIQVFQQAFPTTPWMFVYRDPVQVVMSYLSEGDGRNANCVRPQRNPPEIVERLVEKYSPQQAKKAVGGGRGGGGARDLSYQDYCAAHVASLTESAVEHMNDYGTPVNYVNLPHILYDEILPNRWHVPIGQDEIHRIQQISTQYSKQGARHFAHPGGLEFKGDSEKKEKMASPEVHLAAQTYLQPSFETLEQMAQEKQTI